MTLVTEGHSYFYLRNSVLSELHYVCLDLFDFDRITYKTGHIKTLLMCILAKNELNIYSKTSFQS